MTNYVNNAYDKCLKPCDAQQFSNIVNSPKTEQLIALYRRGDSRAKVNPFSPSCLSDFLLINFASFVLTSCQLCIPLDTAL